MRLLYKFKIIFGKVMEKIGIINVNTSFESAIIRTINKNIKINSVIDVGSSDGRWSIKLSKYLKNLNYFLIDANKFHLSKLNRLKKRGFNFLISAVGDYNGHIYFDGRDNFGGLAMHNKKHHTNILVPVITIDKLVKDNKILPPYLIKLDTHGFEGQILNGAIRTLKKTNLLVIECYNFDIAKKSLRFYELCKKLEKLGFRCIDLFDPVYRDKDGCFWQFDLVFAKSANSFFKNNNYN